MEFVRVDSPTLPDRPRLDVVNVENGMVRVEDGVLIPHRSRYLSVVQLPVRYDPNATCPNIEAFVASTFPSDAHALAWEIPGVLMVRRDVAPKGDLVVRQGMQRQERLSGVVGPLPWTMQYRNEKPAQAGTR